MASNILRSFQNNNSINLLNKLRNLRPSLENRVMYLSSDESKQLKKIEKNDWELKDRLTHTGQSFSEKDYRIVRFVGKQKEVNTRFAIDLIAEVPPIPCKERIASCDGGGGPLGHPKVFINLDDPKNHSCGYCGLRFYREDTSH